MARVKVLDFGLAKAVSSGRRPHRRSAPTPRPSPSRATQWARSSDTAAYMAPEQAQGQRSTSAPTSGRSAWSSSKCSRAASFSREKRQRHARLRAPGRPAMGGPAGRHAPASRRVAPALSRPRPSSSAAGHRRGPARISGHQRRCPGWTHRACLITVSAAGTPLAVGRTRRRWSPRRTRGGSAARPCLSGLPHIRRRSPRADADPPRSGTRPRRQSSHFARWQVDRLHRRRQSLDP